MFHNNSFKKYTTGQINIKKFTLSLKNAKQFLELQFLHQQNKEACEDVTGKQNSHIS